MRLNILLVILGLSLLCAQDSLETNFPDEVDVRKEESKPLRVLVAPAFFSDLGHRYNTLIQQAIIESGHQLISVPSLNSFYEKDSIICQTPGCLKDTTIEDSTDIVVLVWEWEMKNRFLFIALYSLKNGELVQRNMDYVTEAEGDDQIKIERLVDKCLNHKPIALPKYVTKRNVGYTVGAAAIIVAIRSLVGNRTSEESGIGLPPDWPEN